MRARQEGDLQYLMVTFGESPGTDGIQCLDFLGDSRRVLEGFWGQMGSNVWIFWGVYRGYEHNQRHLPTKWMNYVDDLRCKKH